MPHRTLPESLDNHFASVTRRRTKLPAPQVLVYSKSRGLDYSYGDRTLPFHAASVGKVPTAVLAMQFVEAGKLSLDTPLPTLLPASEFAELFVLDGTDHSIEVTLGQLLSHTSGVADYFEGKVRTGPQFIDAVLAEPERMWQPHELLDWSRERQAPFGIPGKSFLYADTGYILAGRILEELSGIPYQQLLHDRIFSPLGMDDSYLMHRSEPKNGLRPISPLWLDGVEASTFTSFSCGWSDGGIVSTLDDLARFSTAFHSGELLDEKTIAQLSRFHNRFRPGIHYGTGLMQLRFEEFFFLLRGLPRPTGHTGVLGTHMYYDATNDTHIVTNFHSTKEMVRSVRSIIRIEQLLRS